MRRLWPLLVSFLWIASAYAQDPNAPESFQIGLSTNRVAISSDFSGADLTIFGALDNADQILARQGRYDIIVVLEGPARPVTVRKKTRVLGVWVNTQSQSFTNVPTSYAVATTRPMQDIAQPVMYQRLALGSENIFMRAVEEEQQRNPERVAEFTAALRQQKRAAGLYNERIGGVQFLSPSLFRATLSLSPNVPVGTHRARAFLFRNGVFVKETSAQLTIVKAGLEQRIYRMAQDNGLLFGFAAVLLAIITGWLGRLIFRRD
jgi:uncharacterized protein (TIGR02186 family)